MRGVSSLKYGLCLVWLFAVGAGIAMILNYQNTPGPSGATPEHWPAGTPIALDGSHDTLVMFAHPKCPCTRASVEELNRLLALCHGRVTTHVFFFKPSQGPGDWTQTDLRQSVAAIPGVAVHDDPDARMARQFGADTSGYVVLYNAQGQLLYHGGITGSRGHAGDNAGEAAIAAMITGENPGLKEAPVFGCSLGDKFCSQKVAVK